MLNEINNKQHFFDSIFDAHDTVLNFINIINRLNNDIFDLNIYWNYDIIEKDLVKKYKMVTY